MARYSRIFEVTSKKIFKINSLFFKQEVVYAADEITGIPKRRETSEPTPTPSPVFEDRSTSIRLNVEWPRAIRALSKNPLLGTGYSSITLATDNDYLRLLGEVGILGFLAFFLIFLRIGRSVSKAFPLIKKYKRVELGFLAGMIGSFPGLLLNAVFIDIFEASKFAIIFWLLMGFTVGLVSFNKNE
jgi:O-antigen ligase